jgi:cyclic pyranopterin phosphate synthase
MRELLRSNTDDESISAALAHIWRMRSDRYSELRGQQTGPKNKVEMSYIGG